MNRETFLDSFGHVAEAPGGINKLRTLILDLAMRGQLTSRHIEDEPAAEMLARARAEKARRIAAGEIRRANAYPDIEASDLPYAVPEGWQWCRTADLIQTVNGRAFKPAEWAASGLPIIRIQNLNNRDAPFNYYAGDVDQAHLVAPGDLLISWSGTPGTSFGAFVWTGPAGALNQHIFKCGLFDDYRDFICLAINNRLDVLIGDAHGGVGLQHFTKDKLERLPLPIAPLQEQRRIVDRVNELMAACDVLEEQQAARTDARSVLTAATLHRVAEAETANDLRSAISSFAERIDLHLAPGDGDLAALQRLRQTIFDLAACGRLAHQDPDEESATELLDQVAAERDRLVRAKAIRKPKLVAAIDMEGQGSPAPDGWTWSRLGHLVLASDSGWSPACLPEQRTDDRQWAVLKVSAVSWGAFRANEHKVLTPGLEPRPQIEVEDGDFIMSRANTADLVGRSVVASNPPPRLMLSDKHVRLRFRDRITAEFVNLVNAGSRTRSYFATVSTGTSNSMRNITRDQILSIPVAVPPLAEQARIVERVRKLHAMCDELEEKYFAAASLRRDLTVSVAAHVA